MTLPQMIMMLDGDWVNYKRSDKRSDAKRRAEEKGDRGLDKNSAVLNGRRFDELTPEEQDRYMTSFTGGF